MGIRLNLGASDSMHPNSINVDIFRPHNADESFVQADLTQRWPWEDSSVDYIRAHDIIEHLPDKVFTMNEAGRVLRPGGSFEIFVPTTDGRGAWQDPDHKSWWNSNSMFYYIETFPEWVRFRVSEGITCRFRIPGCPNLVSAAQRLEESLIWYPGNVCKLRITLENAK